MYYDLISCRFLLNNESLIPFHIRIVKSALIYKISQLFQSFYNHFSLNINVSVYLIYNVLPPNYNYQRMFI